METAHESGFIWRPLLLAASSVARADDLACVSTTFNLLTPNDKVCVSDFDDPKVPGVTCFFSQARKGSWGQPFGLNEDPSNFSVSCRQLEPIATDLSTLPKYEEAFTEKTSIFFKKAHLSHAGQAHRTLIYLAVSSKLINGSPANSISVHPGHGDVQRPDQGEAERQQEQEIDVAPGDHQPQGS
jgi:CreA protein